jgi:hypothetical protein
MKTMIVAAMFAGMLGAAAHGQAVPSYAPAQSPTADCWVSTQGTGGTPALAGLNVKRNEIEPVRLTAIC